MFFNLIYFTNTSLSLFDLKMLFEVIQNRMTLFSTSMIYTIQRMCFEVLNSRVDTYSTLSMELTMLQDNKIFTTS